MRTSPSRYAGVCGICRGAVPRISGEVHHATCESRDVQEKRRCTAVARAVGVCVGGKSIAVHHASRKKAPPPCQSAFSQHPRALRLWGSGGAEVRGSQRVWFALTTFVGRGREGRGGSTGRRGHCPVPPPKGYYPVPPPKASYRVPPPKGRATAAYLRGARRRSPRGGARSGRRTRAAAQSPRRPPSYGPRRSR